MLNKDTFLTDLFVGVFLGLRQLPTWWFLDRRSYVASTDIGFITQK